MVKNIILALGALSLMPGIAAGQENGLAHRMAALEAQVETLTRRLTALTQPVSIAVDCGAGERLQDALNVVQRNPTPVTVTVFGVCAERIVIARSDLLIRAGAPGAAIVASGPGPAVRVSTVGAIPRIFSIDGLAISGGSPGVQADQASHVRLANCRLHGNSFGVSASHRSIVRLENTIVENNTGAGVSATTGAHVILTGGEVRNNQGDGISLSGSMAVIGGSTQIVSNLTWGIGVGEASSLQLGAAKVAHNGVTGVFVSGGSIVDLRAGATITANQGSGISLMDTSLARKFRALADIHITNNGAYGIVCSVPPAVAQIVGFTFEKGNISGNPSGDIDCPISPGPKSQ